VRSLMLAGDCLNGREAWAVSRTSPVSGAGGVVKSLEADGLQRPVAVFSRACSKLV